MKAIILKLTFGLLGTFILLPINLASAEPAFRYDERKDPNKDQKVIDEPPQRPAYYDAYKKANKVDPNNKADSYPQRRDPSMEPTPVPAQAITPEIKQQAQQLQNQMQNVDPALLQRAQDQMQKSGYPYPTPQ